MRILSSKYVHKITPTGLTFVEFPRQSKAACVVVDIGGEDNEYGGGRGCDRLRCSTAAVPADQRRVGVASVVQRHVVVSATAAVFNVQLAKRY